MWLFFAFLSAITAALVAIFSKLGLKDIDPTLATTIRGTIMAVFLIAVSIVFKKFHGFSFGMTTSKDWFLIVLSAIAGALSWLFYFLALKYGFASRVAIVDRLSVVFVILLAAFFLGEALTWKSVIGSLLIVGGAALVVL